MRRKANSCAQSAPHGARSEPAEFPLGPVHVVITSAIEVVSSTLRPGLCGSDGVLFGGAGRSRTAAGQFIVSLAVPAPSLAGGAAARRRAKALYQYTMWTARFYKVVRMRRATARLSRAGSTFRDSHRRPVIYLGKGREGYNSSFAARTRRPLFRGRPRKKCRWCQRSCAVERKRSLSARADTTSSLFTERRQLGVTTVPVRLHANEKLTLMCASRVRGPRRRRNLFSGVRRGSWLNGSYLVDPASSHMLVSKIKPCMSKYKRLYTVKLRMAH